ncbi:OB-fold nucleic acid binding domain-containing protein, partial [Nocardiopsis sp. NPDC055879]
SLSRESMDNLVLAGALDSLAGVTGAPGAPDRRDVLVHAHALVRAHGVVRGGRRVVASTADQLSLSTGPVEVPVGAGTPMTHSERVAEELRVLGYELSGHLLDRYAERLAELASAHDLVQAQDLHRVPDGARVMVAGSRICTQTPPTRSGRRVVFTTVEDRTGLVDVALFEDAQRHSAASVFGSDLVVVHGRVRRAAPGALPTLTATRVRPLDGNAGASSGKG